MIRELPEYTSGKFHLYRISTDETKDFPEEILIDENMDIWFKEISVFDRTRYEFNQGGIEVTMKIRIPKYNDIGSRNMCEIDGKQHLVYNAAQVRDKNGFEETELTLVRPESELVIV